MKRNPKPVDPKPLYALSVEGGCGQGRDDRESEQILIGNVSSGPIHGTSYLGLAGR